MIKGYTVNQKILEYLEINYNRKEYEKEYVCVRVYGHTYIF